MNEIAAELRGAVEKALRAPYRRITPCLTLRGTRLWLKRVERSSPLLWVVKGTPKKAFNRDRRSHRFLWNSGAPVPEIVSEGSDYIVIKDAGASLTNICACSSLTVQEKAKVCRAAGQTLARLHSADVTHGRPAFRDMCWDGKQIRFIDFEYFVHTRAGWLRKVRDVGIALVSALCQGINGPRYAHALLSAYRATQYRRSEYPINPFPQRTE